MKYDISLELKKAAFYPDAQINVQLLLQNFINKPGCLDFTYKDIEHGDRNTININTGEFIGKITNRNMVEEIYGEINSVNKDFKFIFKNYINNNYNPHFAISLLRENGIYEYMGYIIPRVGGDLVRVITNYFDVTTLQYISQNLQNIKTPYTFSLQEFGILPDKTKTDNYNVKRDISSFRVLCEVAGQKLGNYNELINEFQNVQVK